MSRTLGGRLACGALAVSSLIGCVYHRDKVDESGFRVSDQTLAQVEIGHTTRAWVIATLGEPSSATRISENPRVEVLRYESAMEHQKSSWIILYGSDKERKYTRNTYFEVTEGVVTRVWRDEAPGVEPTS